MEKTIIRFKRKQVLWPVVIGILTMGCSACSAFFGDNQLTGLLVIGALWVGIGIHRQYSGYIVVKSDSIRINDAPLYKTIRFDEIREVKHFAGDWIVKYRKDKEIYLNPNWVSPKSLTDFESIVRNLQNVSAQPI